MSIKLSMQTVDSCVIMVMLDGIEVSQISFKDFILDPSKLLQC